MSQQTLIEKIKALPSAQTGGSQLMVNREAVVEIIRQHQAKPLATWKDLAPKLVEVLRPYMLPQDGSSPENMAKAATHDIGYLLRPHLKHEAQPEEMRVLSDAACQEIAAQHTQERMCIQGQWWVKTDFKTANHYEEERHLKRLLAERDSFIVSKDLWHEFVASLDNPPNRVEKHEAQPSDTSDNAPDNLIKVLRKLQAWVTQEPSQPSSLDAQQWVKHHIDEALSLAMLSKREIKHEAPTAVRDIETIRALFQTIRCKLERRFQVSDYLADGGDRDDVRPVRVVVSDICQEVMAHVREVRAFAERGEKLALTIS
jgi:hypothetical protein